MADTSNHKRKNEEEPEERPRKLQRLNFHTETTSLLIPSDNEGLQLCRNLINPNIVICLDAFSVVGKNECRFVYEHIDKTLEDVLNDLKVPRSIRVKCWKRTKTDRVIGVTVFLREILIGLLDAVIFLRGQKLKHNAIGLLPNTVFSRGKPKLHNFSLASKCDGTNVNSDFEGIADLVESLLKRCGMTRRDLNLELRSFLSLLRNYPAKMKPEKIKEHPALFTAEDRSTFVFRMGVSLGVGWKHPKGSKHWKGFNQAITNYGDPAPSFSQWRTVAVNKACFQVPNPTKPVSDASELGWFTYNTYKHINDDFEDVKYNDEKLEKIFLKRFPSLFICFWFYINKISFGLLKY